MGTKVKLSTKALSVLLSVILAASCFSMALPTLAPRALAVSANQWNTLADALYTAYNAGYFATDAQHGYSVTVDADGLSTIVEDITTNGYMFNIVRATADILKSFSNDEDKTFAHNRLALEEILTAVNAKYHAKSGQDLNAYQRAFLSEIIPMGPDAANAGTENDTSYWGNPATNATLHVVKTEVESHWEEGFTFMMEATRTAEAAILSDYASAYDVPKKVETSYALTVNATVKTSDEGETDPTLTAVFYSNDDATSGVATTTVDISAVTNYLTFVNEASFAADYEAYVADATSVYYLTNEVIAARLTAYAPLRQALNTDVSQNVVETFITQGTVNAYDAFMNVLLNAQTAISLRPYVDWIKGGNIDTYYNKRNYQSDDYRRLMLLKEQARGFKSILDQQASETQAILTAKYAYDANEYDSYINELDRLISLCQISTVASAVSYMMNNAAPEKYTAPADSAYGNLQKATGTEIQEGVTYYTVDDTQTRTKIETVKNPQAADIGTYYVANPLSYLAVGNYSYRSEDYELAGKECPVTLADLEVAIDLFSRALGFLADPEYAADAAHLFDAAAVQSFYNDLVEEKEYRLFEVDDENDETQFIDYYRWFVREMLAGQGIYKGDEDLFSTDYIESQKETPDPNKKSYIKEATEKYTAMTEKFAAITTTGTVRDRYQAVIDDCDAYITSLYQEVYNRLYYRSLNLAVAVKRKGINANSGSELKALIAATKYEAETQEVTTGGETETVVVGATSTLYKAVSADMGKFTERGIGFAGYNDGYEDWPAENAATGMSFIKNMLNAILIEVSDERVPYGGNYKAKVDVTLVHYQVWNRFSEVSAADGNGVFTTRLARSTDIARVNGEDYVVSKAVVTQAITGLDGFLANENFARLIGVYDQPAGVTNLNKYIDNLLKELVFSDSMVNTLIGLIFPMLTNLLEGLLVDLFNPEKTMLPDGWVTQATMTGADAALDLTKIQVNENLWFTDGKLNLWVDGKSYENGPATSTFPVLFESLGLYLYPESLLKILNANFSASQKLKYQDFLTALGAAGRNWSYFNGINPIDPETGEAREGYNDFDDDGEPIVNGKDFKMYEWDVHNFNDFTDIMGIFFTAAIDVLRTIFTGEKLQKDLSNLAAAYGTNVKVNAYLKKMMSGNVLANLLGDDAYVATIDWIRAVPSVKDLTIYGANDTGLQGYNDVWVPIMEALGLTGTLDGENNHKQQSNGTYLYTPTAPFSSTLGTCGTDCTGPELVYGLFYPLLVLIQKLAEKPITELCSLLPNIAYNISYGCIEPLLQSLTLSIGVKLDLTLDVNDIGEINIEPDPNGGSWWNRIVAWLADKLVPLFKTPIVNAVNDLFPLDLSSNIPDIALSSMFDLDDLLGDVTSLNAILLKFLPDLELPPMNLARLGQMGKVVLYGDSNPSGHSYEYRNNYSPRTTNYNANLGPRAASGDEDLNFLSAHKYLYVEADVAEVLYAVFNYLFRAVKQNGLVSRIIASFGGSGLGATLDEILTGVDDEKQAFAALMELLVPNGATYQYGPDETSTFGTAYRMADYDWYISAQAAEEYNLAQSSKIYGSVSASNFVYLKENDWNRPKAELFYNDLENTLTDVIKAFAPDLFTKAGVDSVSAWLSKTIDNLFSNGTLTSLVKALVGLGKSLAGQEIITNMIHDQIEISGVKLGVDMLTWYKTYGYLFDMIPKSIPNLARPTQTSADTENAKAVTDAMFAENVNRSAAPITEAQLEELQKIKEGATGILLLPDGEGRYSKYIVGDYNEKTGKWKKLMLIPFADGEDYGDAYMSAHYNNKVPFISFTKSVNGEGETEFTWSTTVNHDSVVQWTGAEMYSTLTLTDGAADARAVFTAIVASLIEPLAPVVSLLLSADDLGMFFYDYLYWYEESWGGSWSSIAYPTPAIQLKGYDCYDGALIPLLEVLGVEDLLTQEAYSDAYAISKTPDNMQASLRPDAARERAVNGLYYLVNKIFLQLDGLLTVDVNDQGEIVGKTPLQKIIDLLPKIYYFLQSNGLSTMVDNLLKPVFVLVDTLRPIVDVDLNNLAGYLICKLLGYNVPDTYTVTALTRFVAEKVLTFKPDLAGTNKPAAVEALMNVKLDNLTLQSIFTIAEGITGINFLPITYALEGICEGEQINGVNYGILKAGVSLKENGQLLTTSYSKDYFTLNYYGPDVLTVTLSVVLDLLMFGNNAEAIDELFGLLAERTATEQILDENGIQGLVEGLKAIFGENAEAATVTPDWDYLIYNDGHGAINPVTGQLVIHDPDRDHWSQLRDFVSSDLKQYHSLPALYYLVTDWTYDTAKATDNMLATILDFLTTAVLRENKDLVAVDDKDTVTTFSNFVEYLLNNKLASADMMKTLVGLIAKLYNKVPASLINLVGTTLDVPLNTWITDPDPADDNVNAIVLYGEHEVDNDATPEKTTDTAPHETKRYYTAIFTAFTGTEFAKGETYYVENGGDYEKTEDTAPQDGTAYYTAVFTEFTGTAFEEGVTYYAVTRTKTVTEYFVNEDYKWFVETDPAYVDDMDSLVAAVEELLYPAANLLAFVFLEDDIRLFKTIGSGSEADIAAARDQIILNGLNMYERGLVPLFEAIKGGPLKEQYKTSAFLVTDAETGLQYYSGEAFIHGIVQLVLDFVNEIKGNPVTWLLDRLPGIIYFINANGLTAAVKNILGSVQILIDTINTMLDASSRLSVSNLGGLDLSNMTMGGILDLVSKYTGLHFRDDLRKYLNTFYMGKLRSFNSVNGKPAFTMDLSAVDGEAEENRANFITIFITLMVEILLDEGVWQDPANGYRDTPYSNPEAIDKLIKKDGLVKQIAEALKNPASIVYEDVNWNYFDVNFNLAEADVDPSTQRVLGVPAYTFQYLNYATQWTYTKAATTAAGLEDIILGVLKMINKNKYEDITSIGQLELLDVDVFFTGETLHKLITLLKGFLFEGKLKIGDVVITEDLVNFVGQLLSADLLSWKDYDFANAPADGAVTDDDHILPYLAYQDKETADETPDAAKTYYYNKTTYAVFTGTAFAEGETYYELNDGHYDITADSDPDGEKTYYTSSTAYVGETGAAIGEFAEGVSYYERSGGVTYLVNGREDFIKGLSLLVSPAEKLLGWLLFGDSYTFFNGSTAVSQNEVLITLPGSDGYGKGLVLLLEALGCKGLKLASSYYNEAQHKYNTGEFISDLLVSLTDRIDEILADPINQIVGLIPELIYFINAGGLQTVIANLLAGPLTLVNSLTSIIGSNELDVTVVDSLIDKALKNGLKGMMEGHKTHEVIVDGETKEVYDHDLPAFSMKGINLKFIFELLEAISDIEITDPAGNKLQYFKIGDIYRYMSMGGPGGKEAYKMAFSDEEDFADFITILFSFVLDVLLYDEDGTAVNKDAVAALLGKALKNNSNKDTIMAIVEAVIQFLSDGFTVEVQDINWLYFDPDKNIYDENGKRNDVVIDENTRFTMPVRTINYLTYASDWSEDLVNYVYDNRVDLINQVLTLTKLDTKTVFGDVTVGQLLGGGAIGVLDQLDVFTAENLNLIRSKLTELVGKIPQVVLDLLNIVIDIDFSRYSDATSMGYIDEFTAAEVENYVDPATGTVNPRKGFVNGLCELLNPLDTILDWLFFGENNSLEYFDAIRYDENGNVIPGSYEVLLSINGSNGYEYGMIPILEMLGVSDLPIADENATISTMLPKIVDALITRVDEILADPINEVLALLPNLLYFINANGLSASVANLLAAPMALVNEVATDGDINALLKGFGLDIGDVDIMHLDLAAVISILENVLSVKAKEATETEPAVEAVKFEIITPAGSENEFLTYEKIKNFFFGAIELSVSANGKPRGTMVYTAEETPADMLTIIINFAVELILHGDNAKALDIALKLKDGTMEAIVGAIDTLATKVLPGNYHWNYFNENGDDDYNMTEGLTQGVLVAPPTPFNNYLTYKSDWTANVANGLYDNLGSTIDAILTMIAGDNSAAARTLGELLSQKFTLYSAENLNKILGLTDQLYDKLGSLVDIVGLLLSCDLSAWNGLHFEEGDVTNRATFKAGLMEILKPLYPLLDWLLFGKDYGFFVNASNGNVDPVTGARLNGELLKLAGREGFAYGLMPLLSEIGVTFPEPLVAGEMSCEENLEGIVDAILNRVDEILENPVDEALVLLPNLLYFINANGLATMVENLLGSITAAANMLVDMGVLKVPQRDEEGHELKDENDNVLYVEGADIFDFIADAAGIDIMNLDLEGIFHILETKVGALQGLKLNEVFTRDFDGDGVEENILEKFYVGYGATASNTNVFVRDEDDSLTEYIIYKMIPENIEAGKYRGDILTMLLSIVLEVVLYDGNVAPITAIINNALNNFTAFSGDAFAEGTVYYEKNEEDKYVQTEDASPVEGKTYYTKSEFTQENFLALKAMLTAGVQSGQMAYINWVYFLNITDADALKAAIIAVIENPSSNTLPAQIERTTNYLKYEHTNPGTSLNLWSEDFASSLLDDLDGTVSQVLQMVMKDETMTLSKFIREKIDLFSDEFGAKIVGMLTDALAGLDDVLSDDVLNTVGALLGAEDLASLKTAEFHAGITDDMTSEEKIQAFSAEFARILSPANRLLEWLLFGGSYRFFTHLEDGEPATLTINGGEGYKYGLAPILYALGVETDLTLDYDATGKLDFNKAFTDILVNVFTRVDELLYQDKVAEEVLSLLPELIYFINANGLGASVQNLLAPVEGLLKEVGKAIGKELSLGSLLKIDLDHLDFSFIFKLVQDKTGLILSDEDGEPIGDYLTKFYFGKLESGLSYGDLVNFRMVYSDTEEKHDMLTILLELVLDVATYEGNAAFIQNLIDKDDPDNAARIFEMVKAFLYNPDYVKKVKMVPYNWIWTQYDINGGGAEAGKILTPLNVNGSEGTALLDGAMYGPLYKREMGEYMTRYLTLLINTYITLLGIDNGHGGTYRSLDEILDGLIGNNIYKTSLLEKIADAISGAIGGLKEKVGDELFDKIVEILESSLQVDLSALLNASVPEDFEEGNQQSFIRAISEMLSPAAPILRWLLTSQDIALFSNREGFDYVVIRGADGYQNAIVPILEALLGGDPESNTYILTQAAFEAATNRPNTEGMDAEAAAAANRAADTAMLENILNPIFNRVNEILADPLTEIFAELPAVIYFINSQGLDSAFKNLLNPVYEVLTIIEPALKNVSIGDKSLYLKDENNEVVYVDGVPQVDFYGLIGIDLATLDLAALVDTLLDKLNNSIDTGDLQLADLIRNNLGDLTMGKVRSFNSKRLVDAGASKNSPYYSYADETWTLPGGVADSDKVRAKDYTMVYAGSGFGAGDKTDMVTVILKILLSFISEPGNVRVIEGFLKDRVSDDGYKFLCSLLENFSQMAKSEGGQDKIMYTVYYIFYTALTAGVATNNGLAQFNYDYSFLNRLFATSDVAFFRQLEQSFGDLLNKWTGDVVSDTEVAPNGLIKFFKAISNFFKKISNFFKSLFGK